VAADARVAACWYGDAEPLVALLAGRYQPLTNLGSSHLWKTEGGEQNRKTIFVTIIARHVILILIISSILDRRVLLHTMINDNILL